jgi:Spy/CpxP family protein refolding chaperone
MLTSTRKAVALLLLAVVLGGALGSMATARVMGHHHEDRDNQGRGSDWYIGLLRRELELNPQQQDSVRAILRRHRREMDSIYATLSVPMAAMRETIRTEIRALLTPDQQKRYAVVTARLDAARRERSTQDSTDR